MGMWWQLVAEAAVRQWRLPAWLLRELRVKIPGIDGHLVEGKDT